MIRVVMHEEMQVLLHHPDDMLQSPAICISSGTLQLDGGLTRASAGLAAIMLGMAAAAAAILAMLNCCCCALHTSAPVRGIGCLN